MKISQLKFDKQNANRGTERGKKALASSLEQFGAGRACYGMELDPKYLAVTLEGLEKQGLKPKLSV